MELQSLFKDLFSLFKDIQNTTPDLVFMSKATLVLHGIPIILVAPHGLHVSSMLAEFIYFVASVQV